MPGQTGNDCPWTAQEIQAMSKLKEQLKDLDFTNPILEDRRLINWLRARDLRIESTEGMLRKHLEWREENKIDTILTSGIVPVNDPLLVSLPVEIIGYDRKGLPVLAAFGACLDIKMLMHTYGKEMRWNILHYLLETAYAAVIKQSIDPNVFVKVNYILDMDGIRLKEFMSPEVLEFLITTLKTVEANYPELLNKACLLNAPFIFSALWSILKKFITPATMSKIEMLGHHPAKIEKTLLELIPEDQLPKRWGGKGFSERIPILNTTLPISNKTEGTNKDFNEIVISAGESFQIEFEVESPKAVISWVFKTKNYDLGFSILHKPFPTTTTTAENDATEKHEYKRVNAQIQFGCFICDVVGQYILRFDNTYSRFREKTLMYHVEMTQLTTNGNEIESDISGKETRR